MEVHQSKLLHHAYRCLASAKKFVDDGQYSDAVPILDLLRPMVDDLPQCDSEALRTELDTLDQFALGTMESPDENPAPLESRADKQVWPAIFLSRFFL
jgi:hypothetical protein